MRMRSAVRNRKTLGAGILPALACLSCLAWGAPSLAGQDTRIQAFGATGLSWVEGSDGPQFVLGDATVFVSSNLPAHFRILGELSFHNSGGHDSRAAVERLRIAYEPSRRLRISIGRHHTPIGAWNTDYHHGQLLTPTIDRPLMFAFHEESVLPLHSLGVGVSGTGVGPLDLGYDLMVANGEASTTGPDGAAARAITARIFSRIATFTRVGVGWHTVSLGAGAPPLRSGHGHSDAGHSDAEEEETIGIPDPLRLNWYSGFLAHEAPRVELRAEYARAHGRATDSGRVESADLFYVYAGLPIGSLVPYGLVEAIGFSADARYLNADDAERVILGVRWDASVAATFKAEFRRHRVREDPAVHSLVLQAAVGI